MEENVTLQDTNADELDLSGAFEEYTDTDTSAAESAPQKEEWGLDVVFNGEKKTLTRDEAIANAQKGMNYDHVYAQLEKYRAAEADRKADTDALSELDQTAQLMGMDRAGYLDFLRQQRRQAEIDRITREGVAEPYAEQVYELKQAHDKGQERIAALEKELQTFRDRDIRREQWSKFFANHTDIGSFEELPDEVKSEIAAGTEPEAAYSKWEVKSLREQLAHQKQAQKNAETAPGSARGDGAAEVDSFEAALAAAFRA